jgi:hypothetical protein
MESAVIQAAPTSKKMNVTGWILSGLVGLMMIGGGVYGLTHLAAVKEQMHKYGYPDNAVLWMVLAQLISAVLYLVPQTAVLGAILLTGYLGGAVATHVRAGENFALAVIVGVVVWLGLFLRDARIRALVPLRSSETR